jgi:hypothetical protein
VPHECLGVHALPIYGKHVEPLLNKAGNRGGPRSGASDFSD